MILVKVIVYWLLGVAALYDDGVAGLAETAGLLALDVAPRRLEVLTTPPDLDLPSPPPFGWSTGFIVIPRTVGRTPTAGAAGLAGHFVHVLGIANLTDGAVAILIETADFAGGHLDQRIACFTVGKQWPAGRLHGQPCRRNPDGFQCCERRYPGERSSGASHCRPWEPTFWPLSTFMPTWRPVGARM